MAGDVAQATAMAMPWWQSLPHAGEGATRPRDPSLFRWPGAPSFSSSWSRGSCIGSHEQQYVISGRRLAFCCAAMTYVAGGRRCASEQRCWRRHGLRGVLPLTLRAAKDGQKAEDKDADGNIGDGIKNWIDRKKSEASGGAGGALVGGMLMGPLGAVVGAQIGTRLAPELDKALTDWEEKTEENEKAAAAEAAAATKSAPSPPAQQSSSRAAAPKEQEIEVPRQSPPAPAPSSSSSSSGSPTMGSSRPPSPQPTSFPSRGLDQELSDLKAGMQTKKVKLEEEAARLTATAEAALREGDEEKARSCLVERADVNEKLKRLLEGEEAQRRKAEEERLKLEKQSQELLSRAQASLEAGDEDLARAFLTEREKVKAQLNRLDQ